jgi:ubiquinone/menaquinone biosynthesis C-methylase UbiE
MNQEKKLTPMSNTSFKLMSWFFDLNDNLLHLSKRPQQHIRQAPLKTGMTVVDYACGPGRYTIPLAEKVGPSGKVYAVDIQPLAIQSVRKKAAARSLKNIQPVLVDSYHTGIPGGSADLVLLIDAIQSIKEPLDLLAEIHRILKPGGTVFMDAGHMKTEEVTQIIKSSGFFNLNGLKDKDMLLTRKDK